MTKILGQSFSNEQFELFVKHQKKLRQSLIKVFHNILISNASVINATIDRTMNLCEWKARMRMDKYDDRFTEINFPIHGQGQEKWELKIAKNLQEERELKHEGWQSAQFVHLLFYATEVWDGKTRVVARGSFFQDGTDVLVPFIQGASSDRGMFLYLDGGWRGLPVRLLVSRRVEVLPEETESR